MSIKIAIVEDDKSYNDTLKRIIDFQNDMEVIAQYYNGSDAVEKLENNLPQVVLMDIQLQDMSGIHVIRALKTKIPNTQFIMCTSFEDDEKIFDSLKAGATGYLVKGESMDKILSSIREVNDGGAPMTFTIARKVLQHFKKKDATVNKELETLSIREVEDLELLSQGLLYKEIADRLSISLDTVKKHIGNTYQKLHVTNKVEAINMYNQNKI